MKVDIDVLLWRRYCVDAFIRVKLQLRISHFCSLVSIIFFSSMFLLDNNHCTLNILIFYYNSVNFIASERH